MDKKNLIYVVVAAFAVSTITGCGTAQKKRQAEEIKGIKTQVEQLQSRVETVETKQAEAERLAAERSQLSEEATSEKISGSNLSIKPRFAKSRESVREIQACLKSAGFYSGKVDGKRGRNTKKAIKEFQKANGLTPDGVVGKKTRELLSKYNQGSGSSPEVEK